MNEDHDYRTLNPEQLLQAAERLAARSQADQTMALRLRQIAQLKQQAADLERELPPAPVKPEQPAHSEQPQSPLNRAWPDGFLMPSPFAQVN